MLEVNFSPFPKLSTTRLLLRRLEATDAEQLFTLRSDEKVMKYIGKKPMENIDEANAFINLINDNVNNNSGINWAITLKEAPGNLIGVIGLWRIIKEHYRAEIGYMLRPEFWRKGIINEAILGVTDYGFSEMKLHSIQGNINAINIASAKALESAGFVREAFFKEDFFFDGKFVNTEIYSILNPNPF
ncbi:MAG: GNAT family N-acetyltransferase [Ginsengibacter sp.]